MSTLVLRAAHRRMIGAWGWALLFGALASGMARHGSQVVPAPRPLEELSYYPSGEHLRPAALGHAESAADLAWVRAVQYYGEHRYTDNRFVRMEHVFEILTTLAPHFLPAYVFGSFALEQEGHDFPAAERLMQKGLSENPRSGELAFEAGFLYFVKPGERDYRQAARYFSQAARQTDAPPQAARFAAFSGQQSGDLSTAYELWAEVARTSRNRYLRDMADKEMRAIRAAVQSGHAERVIRHMPTPVVLMK